MNVVEAPGARPTEPPLALETHLGGQFLLLAGWTLFWGLAQAALRTAGWGAKAQLGGFFLGLAMALGVVWAGFRAKGFRVLTATSFAVAQILWLGGVVLLGTLVPQGWTADAYRESLGPGLAGWVLRLQLTDVFGSLWFLALLALLSMSMLAVTWKRRPYSLPRVGFLLVHIAPTFLFLSGLWGLLVGVQAEGELKVGQGTYTFLRTQGLEAGRPYVLPGFQVRLERLETRRRAPTLDLEARLAEAGQPSRRSPSVALAAEGQRGELPGGLRFEVERLIPNAVQFALEPGRMPVSTAPSPDPDLLLVLLGVGRVQPLMGVLRAFGPEDARKDEPSGRFAVLFRDRLDARLLAALQPRPPSPGWVEAGGGGTTRRVPAQVGEGFSLAGGSLRILEVFPDFQILKDPAGNPRPGSCSREPRDPWLLAEWSPAAGVPPRRVLLSARQPEYTDRLNAPHLPEGFSLRYVRDGGEAQRRFVVFTREAHRVALVEGGTVVREGTWALELPFVVEPGFSVTPVGLFDGYHPAPSEGPQLGRAALRIRVTDPRTGAVERTWLQIEGAEHWLMEGRVRLALHQAPPAPEELRSTLVVTDPQGRELARKVVAVNDPLLFDGHAFLQSPRGTPAADASAIRVVDQGGAWIAWVGYGLLLVGLPWMFYLKPWLKRRQGAVR